MRKFRRPPLSLMCCFFLFNNIAFAQPPSFSWVRTFGSAPDVEESISVGLDSNKAVIVAGQFYNTIDFDAGSGVYNISSNGSQDVFVTKYTSNGNFVWARSIGGTSADFVREMKNDRQGNLYFIGIFQSTVDFDPGPGVFNVTPVSGSNTYLLKLDKNGNFVWVQSLRVFSNTLDVDDNGNIFMGGNFGGTRDFDPGPGVFNMTGNSAVSNDMFVMKLDNSGNFVWARQLRNLSNSNSMQQFGMETDPSGNVFFAGNINDAFDFDPGPANFPVNTNGSDDAFILKLNAQGDFQWVAKFGAGGSDKAFGLEVDRQGNVLSTGQFSNTVDFDPGPGIFPLTSPTAGRSTFISKLDPSGSFVYAKNFQAGESFGQALSIDSINNLYISGGYRNTVDFDPGPGIYNVPNGGLYTVKLSPTGNFIWAAGYSATGPTLFESIYSTLIVEPSTNSVYYGSSFPTEVDFDPGPGIFPVAPAGGFWDAFLHKLGPAGCNNVSRNNITAQACNFYTLNGTTYTSSGQYYQQLTNAAGCDSIIQLNLTISTILTNQAQTSCGPFSWNGKILNSSGIYRDTIRLANGCDSIVVLNLTVNIKPVPDLGPNKVICSGDTIRLSAGTFTAYVWNNGSSSASIDATLPGIYWVEVTAANGCIARDSVTIATSGSCTVCADPSLVQKVYPAPFRKTLTIEIKPSICEIKMDIYNVLGQLIMKGYSLPAGKNTLNMDRYPSAAYFYRIYSENAILAKGKILKQ